MPNYIIEEKRVSMLGESPCIRGQSSPGLRGYMIGCYRGVYD